MDPVLTQLSNATATSEIPLNIALIVIFLALGIGLAVFKYEWLRPFLVASIAFGMILTGMATDFNSGLLLIVMALAVWPHVLLPQAARSRYARAAREVRKASEESQAEGPGAAQRA